MTEPRAWVHGHGLPSLPEGRSFWRRRDVRLRSPGIRTPWMVDAAGVSPVSGAPRRLPGTTPCTTTYPVSPILAYRARLRAIRPKPASLAASARLTGVWEWRTRADVPERPRIFGMPVRRMATSSKWSTLYSFRVMPLLPRPRSSPPHDHVIPTQDAGGVRIDDPSSDPCYGLVIRYAFRQQIGDYLRALCNGFVISCAISGNV